MDVKTFLIEKLIDEFRFPVYLQGSMSESDVYPETFFTFWNNYTTDEGFYDNRPTKCVWEFDINIYSSDPLVVNKISNDTIELLRNNNFITDGKGHDVMSDEQSHTGRGLNAIYIEQKERI